MGVSTFHNKITDNQEFKYLSGNDNSDNSGLNSVVYGDIQAFEKLSTHWQNLAVRSGTTIYMTHEWAQMWWNNFGNHKRRLLSIFTLWDETKLVALAPFYVGFSSVGPFMIERRLHLIGSGGSPNEQMGFRDDYGISDFLDIIVDPDYETVVASLLSKFITENKLDVDRVCFNQARDDSFVLNRLYPELQKTGFNVSLEEVDTCPYIELKGQVTLKEYIKQLNSSNARRRFRQTLRAIGPDKEYIIEEAKSWEQVERATDKIIEMHQNRWNKIGFPGVFHDERFTRFFKEIVQTSFENGWLWFKQARDKEGVCAGRMILRFNDRYFDYISGFDDDRTSSKYRPGIGLLIDLVREGIEGDISRIELLRGEEGYKYDFTSDNFKNWKLELSLQKQSVVRHLAQRVLTLVAGLYKRTVRELRLLGVQHKNKGKLKMIPGYLSFRLNSFRLKFGNR